MKYLIILALILTGCGGGSGSDPDSGLVFEDDFDGDLSQWTEEWRQRPNKGVSWRWEPDNVWTENGKLVIKYSKDWEYAVGAVLSNRRFKYGYFEASIKIVETEGMQSCFWLMPDYIDGYDGTGNDGLEIDILESNKQRDAYSITIHHDGYGQYHQASGKVVDAPGIHEGYNTFAMDWTPEYLKFYYNGKLVRTIDDPTKIPHVEEYIILSGSVFVNGWVDGDLSKASLPAYMYVDWIRVYQ